MIALLLAAALLGPRTAAPADVSAATQAYHDCMRQSAEAHDDGKTKPRFLAKRVALQCRPVLEKLVNTASIGRSPEVRYMMYGEKLRQENDVAVSAIERHRQQH